MERRKFFKATLGIAALPLIPDFIREVAPVPQLVEVKRIPFLIGEIIAYPGGAKGRITESIELSPNNKMFVITPLSVEYDLGNGAGRSTFMYEENFENHDIIRLSNVRET